MALPIWPSRILEPCTTVAMSETRSGVPFWVLTHGLADIVHVAEKSQGPHIDLLQALFDKTAAGIDVIVGQRLFHLAEIRAVGDQLVGIDAHLIFPRGASEADHIHDVRNGLELFFERPVLQAIFSSIRSYFGLVLCSVYQ